MAYQTMVTNEDGEPLGIETHYDDEFPDYDSPFDDDFPDYDPGDGYEDDPFRSEQETDLAGEWS